MTDPFSKDPLHGVTLETIVRTLSEELGWEQLARHVRIRSFAFDPSVASSLKFLRRTPWARAEVEKLYVEYLRYKATHETGREPPGEKEPRHSED